MIRGTMLALYWGHPMRSALVAPFILRNFVSVEEDWRQGFWIRSDPESILVEGASSEQGQTSFGVPVELDQTVLFVEHSNDDSGHSGDDFRFHLANGHEIRRN